MWGSGSHLNHSDSVHQITMNSNDRDETEESMRRCPACDAPVESVQDIGPVTWVLEPCGHQIDDRIHTDFWSESE